MEKVTDTEISSDLILLAEAYFGAPPSFIEPLKGDGSDRRIYRIFSTNNQHPPIVGVLHSNIAENRDFFLLTQKFQETGLLVPRLYSVNSGENAYLMQDLGPHTLADKVADWNMENRPDKILGAYQLVLDSLYKIQHELPMILADFFQNRKMNVSVYQADLDYFRKDFIVRFGFESLLSEPVKKELNSILFDHLADLESKFFVYRDFQVRNIMWLDGNPWFIDYQSAFLGPRYYDIASLLFGSKSGLDESTRELLNRYYFELLDAKSSFGYEKYQQLFFLFVILRRLRSLGTYGYLSSVKGKTEFFTAILPSLKELAGLNRSQSCLKPFVNLFGMLRKMRDIWEQREDEFHSRLIRNHGRKRTI
ncbi:MAG: phosphotransferase [SAR324 cluster bacterium]|nr:phosphotransferase [SAR324 cluster bacterium]